MGMEHSDKELAIIILKSAYTSLTQEEQDKLHAYLNASEANRTKYEELTDTEQLRQKMAHYANRNQNEALHFETILQQLNKKPRIYPLPLLKKYRWLAAAIVLLAAGAWLLTHYITQKRKTPALVAASRPQPIMPGKAGAVLTLDDGSQLVLDSMGNGIVATQQGARVVLKNGQLAYDKTHADKEDLIYNTLATPKGREFNLSLPDGTQAWLNSGSSIRYPIRFNSKERIVYITGEVYFEVAKMSLPPTPSNGGEAKRIPFVVEILSPNGEAGEGRVEVLGTHFNINAYENVFKTTLLEGKVKVSSMGNGEWAMLKPGQQASVSQTSQHIVINNANIDKVMAWRRGFFYFDDAGLKEVMQQLARWYDIEVEYRGSVPAITFAGEMSRGMTWPGVLKALEDSKVHFKIEGRKIIILP
jgi:ferric-dicitrate binding protein FerR (iron transport regulator)